MKPTILGLFALALLGCSDAATGPISPATAYVAGQVLDDGSQPIPLVLVGWRVWPSPDPMVPNSYGYAWTDSLGRFSSLIGAFSGAQLDSVLLDIGGDICSGHNPGSETWRALALDAGRADTVVQASFSLPRSSAPARLALGPSCATSSFEDQNGIVSETLGLWIDEMSDSIRGRWRLNFQVSRGDDYGHFSGMRAGDSLTLALRHDAPWGTCTGYTMHAAINPGDTLSVAHLTSPGCPTDPVGFRLFEGEGLRWPFEP